MKKLIFNADDFGNSIYLNRGIKKGVQSGVISRTSIMANAPEFNDAMFNVLPEIQQVELNVHLNIIEGYSLTQPSLITNRDGKFIKSYFDLISLAKNEEFIKQIEYEFRTQIEKVQSHANITGLDSHVHTHAIPQIFELTCKLAQEYGIKYVRTQHEEFYLIPNIMKLLSIKFPINLIKQYLLNKYTKINKKTLEQYPEIQTNDFFVGVEFTGNMDEDTIIYGLRAIHSQNCTAEVLIHPHQYKFKEKVLSQNNFIEYRTTQSKTIKNKIKTYGWSY